MADNFLNNSGSDMGLAHGAEINILTGEPTGMTREKREEEATAEKKANFTRQVQKLSDMQSSEGARVVKVVEEQFLKAAKAAIDADPDCKAYMKILRQFGRNKSLAAAAANQLANMAMRDKR